jgi:Tol biopolymer transport system component
MGASGDRSAGRSWLPAALLAAVAVATLWLPVAARGAVGELVLVADTGGSDYGEVGQLRHRPAISADGEVVAYVPQSSGEGDPLFLRDMRAAAPVAIVTPSNRRYPGFDSASPALSASGRYLAFASEEATLSSEDADGGRGPGGVRDSSVQIRDIFVYDRATRKMKLVSRRSGRKGEASSNDSDLPSISADGRYVAYDTESSNLAPGDRLVVGGIYRRDLRSEANQLISGVPGIMFWRPGSFSPDISGDGRSVAFVFQYSPTPYDPKNPPANVGKWLHRRHKQIMLWDSRWKRPKLVSRASGRRGGVSNQHCGEASVSDSGRFVAFVSKAANLAAGDGNELADVFVRDMRRNVTTLVSRVGRDGAPGDGESSSPSISADGRYVAFQSLAANLAPGDGDDDPDVYVKDLWTNRVALVAPGLDGQPSNGKFGAPAITPDGRYVAFGSTSSNISPEVRVHDMAFYRFQLLP